MRPKMSEVRGQRSDAGDSAPLRLCASALNPARPGVLHNYTRGSDGLYRREMHYAKNATEIIVRDSSGRQLYVEHIAADVRGQVTCQTR